MPTKAKAIPGVVNVVQVPSGVAVIAKGFWPAKLGREKLEITWDDGPGRAIFPPSRCANNFPRCRKLPALSREKSVTLPLLSRAPRRPSPPSTKFLISRTA